MVHFVLLFLIPEKEFQRNETATPKIGQNETEYYELRWKLSNVCLQITVQTSHDTSIKTANRDPSMVLT